MTQARILTILKWIGTASGAGGALLISLNIPESGWAFALFLVSSLSWTAAGLIERDVPLWLLNLTFVGIDIVGIVRWLVIPAGR